MPPIIDIAKCNKCGICADVCPLDVFFGSKRKKVPVVSYGEDCNFCSACIQECPCEAITLIYPLYAQPSYWTDK